MGASAPKMKKGFGVFSKLGGLVPSFKSKGKIELPRTGKNIRTRLFKTNDVVS